MKLIFPFEVHKSIIILAMLINNLSFLLKGIEIYSINYLYYIPHSITPLENLPYNLIVFFKIFEKYILLNLYKANYNMPYQCYGI